MKILYGMNEVKHLSVEGKVVFQLDLVKTNKKNKAKRDWILISVLQVAEAQRESKCFRQKLSRSQYVESFFLFFPDASKWPKNLLVWDTREKNDYSKYNLYCWALSIDDYSGRVSADGWTA